MRPGRATAVVALLTAASCSTQPPRRPASLAPPPILTPAPKAVMSARAYITSAASFDLFAIRAAELAATRARDPHVQAQASAELADHRGLSAQQSFAGRRLNLLPSAAMGNSDSRRLAFLAAAVDFDAAYQREMIARHLHHLSISRDVAARSPSPTLRPVARHAAVVLARHLAQLSSH